MPAEHRTNDHGVHKSGIVIWVWALVLVAAIWGCVPASTPEKQSAAFIEEHSKGAINPLAEKPKEEADTSTQLPVRYQNPSYKLQPGTGAGADVNADLATPVGARIAPAGAKPLRMVMQELAKLKSMNISWANDVDKEALVHVTIMAEEDFYEAIDNVLGQLDYFHEMQENTIVIRHKETKKYNIAVPFMASEFSTNVGIKKSPSDGPFLNLNSKDNKFDIWPNIKANMDKILEIDTVATESSQEKEKDAEAGKADAGGATGGAQPADKTQGYGSPADIEQLKLKKASTTTSVKTKGRGFYTIDQPIGLITVTAPRVYQKKVDNYIKSLKGELFRQVSIEAKIIEVTLSNDNTTGLDWSSLLQTSITGLVDPGKLRADTGLNRKDATVTTNNSVTSSNRSTGPDSTSSSTGPNSSVATTGPDSSTDISIVDGVAASTITGPNSSVTTTGPNSSITATGPDSSITIVGPDRILSQSIAETVVSGSMLTQKFMTMAPLNFNVLIDAIKTQGNVEVLSNPKISVMNGQPAMINVGENITYIKSIDSKVDSDTGVISYTIEPGNVLSGLGMGVVATIMDDNQVILNLTPMTSSLSEAIEYRTMGGNQIGLPKVNVREMSTMVRVKNGDMLVVGGLSDTAENYKKTGVVGLGEMPGFFGKLFKRDGTASQKKELIILLRPQIIAF